MHVWFIRASVKILIGNQPMLVLTIYS